MRVLKKTWGPPVFRDSFIVVRGKLDLNEGVELSSGSVLIYTNTQLKWKLLNIYTFIKWTFLGRV